MTYGIGHNQPLKPRAILRWKRDHVLVLCPIGHYVTTVSLRGHYAGSRRAADLANPHYGDIFDRLAWRCQGAGHEIESVA